MPLIWCSISAHGYGHAAQVIPVLNELHHLLPDLRVLLRTQVPREYFQNRLRPPWDWMPAEQDVGCVQHGPLQIDEAATWEAHARFHRTWDARLAEEIGEIGRHRPDLILSDISYLAIAAGAHAGLPTVALVSLSWDVVLEFFPTRTDSRARLIDEIRGAYRRAQLAIGLMPALPLSVFPTIKDVGPVVDPLPPDRSRLRKAVGAADHERVVLVGFGGIPLDNLPIARMAALTPYRFIVSGHVPASDRVLPLGAVDLPFRTILASCDVLMTKPGYSTIVEAVAGNIPVVYVRRFNFADESGLVEYLQRYGRGVELSAKDFADGRWEEALEAAGAVPASPAKPPSPTGARDAAHLLQQLLDGRD